MTAPLTRNVWFIIFADIFLYSYEADFIQSLLSMGKKHSASQFNLTCRYIDDVLSINNPEFENNLGQMYPAELEIKDTTESTTSASCLDLLRSLLSTGKKHLASRFNFTYRYIDDVLSINNPEFENYLGQMYPAELEIMDTTDTLLLLT